MNDYFLGNRSQTLPKRTNFWIFSILFLFFVHPSLKVKWTFLGRSALPSTVSSSHTSTPPTWSSQAAHVCLGKTANTAGSTRSDDGNDWWLKTDIWLQLLIKITKQCLGWRHTMPPRNRAYKRDCQPSDWDPGERICQGCYYVMGCLFWYKYIHTNIFIQIHSYKYEYIHIYRTISLL